MSRKVSPFMPLSSLTVPNRPMSSKRSLGGPGPTNAAVGSLVMIRQSSFTFETGVDIISAGVIVATDPVPLPYAQDVRGVAYFTYPDEDAFIYDEADWTVEFEGCPVNAGTSVRGRVLYDPWDQTNVPLWAPIDGIIPGAKAELETRYVIKTGSGNDDVIKVMELEQSALDGDIESSNNAFIRLRMAAFPAPAARVEQTATLTMEIWANQMIWESDMNPYNAFLFPDHTKSYQEYWKEKALLEGRVFKLNRGSTDREIDVFGSKVR